MQDSAAVASLRSLLASRKKRQQELETLFFIMILSFAFFTSLTYKVLEQRNSGD